MMMSVLRRCRGKVTYEIILGLNHKRIVLLVVSPHADPDQAHAIMMTAAGPDNASTVDSLLMGGEEEWATRV
jgi:hypothetical protein